MLVLSKNVEVFVEDSASATDRAIIDHLFNLHFAKMVIEFQLSVASARGLMYVAVETKIGNRAELRT